MSLLSMYTYTSLVAVDTPSNPSTKEPSSVVTDIGPPTLPGIAYPDGLSSLPPFQSSSFPSTVIEVSNTGDVYAL